MAKKKNKKIVRYRKPLNLNVGMMIFALIFIYMIFSIYTYMTRVKVQFYEVSSGSIVNDKQYTGIILRQETTKYTDRAGHVNYFIREGKRSSVGTKVYSLDESGRIASFLEENQTDGSSLTDNNLDSLKKQLSSFSLTYDEMNFESVYDVKYDLEAAVLEYANFNALDNLESVLSQQGINFQQVRSDQAGVIAYGIDSYESLKATDVTEDILKRKDYSKKIHKSSDLVEAQAPVYKIITSDEWSIVFDLEDEDKTLYADKTSLKISFAGQDLTASGNFSIITGADGNSYGKLDLDKYMVQFISDRFVEFEIISDKVEGLKIPISAVTTKNFYTVPIAYLTEGGDSSDSGLLKEVYSENGTSAEFVPTTIYYSTDDYYYVDTEDYASGDYLLKPNSTERYQIGATASLEGVYNINKGYAVFKQIDILSSNDEFYIIRKGMSYGLSVYDHIVLDAKSVTEGALIY